MEVLVPLVAGVLVGGGAYSALDIEGDGSRGRSFGKNAREVVARVLVLAGAWEGFIPVAGDGFALMRYMRHLIDASFLRGAVPRRDRRSAAVGLLIAGLIMGGCLGGLLAWSPAGIVIGCTLSFALFASRASSASRSRAERLERALPDAFRSLGVALGSGLSLGQAMSFVAARAEEPVRTEFMRVSLAIDCGIPSAEALDAMLDHVGAPGLELVALALKVSQRTGAPLRGLLMQAAGIAQGRIELKRHLDVKTSQARMSARLVAAMPVGMLCVLSLISSDFRAGVSTVPGAACMAAALVLNAAAWSIIRKIMEVRL